LRFAQTLGIRNKDINQVRWSAKSKPSVGGISFYIIFLIAFIFTILSPHTTANYNLPMIGVLVSITLAFLMGLADDAFNTKPIIKFVTQLVCALLLIFSGHSISIFRNEFVNYFITIIWVVGIMNSINMLDNMDGITSIVSIVICLFIVVINISLLNTNSYGTILNLGMIGALCGFLVFNFHPSKMFMGDTGSQFLGLFLAIFGIDNCWNNPSAISTHHFQLLNIVLVGLVFILPLTDTLTVTINRLKVGKSPFLGGKDHTTHHLFFKGLTEKRIAILFFVINLISIALAYNLIINYSVILVYCSIAYAVLVSSSLYLNTIIKKR
jgi:UDP-GlcNAc:undecaprenyl-phosphate GlcNAc-1-phosphate transferase